MNEFTKHDIYAMEIQRSTQRRSGPMKKIRNFLKDRSGATAITFGLLLIPIMGMTGLAVDYSLASNERSQIAERCRLPPPWPALRFSPARIRRRRKRVHEPIFKANLGDGSARRCDINFNASNQKVKRYNQRPDQHTVHASVEPGQGRDGGECDGIGAVETLLTAKSSTLTRFMAGTSRKFPSSSCDGGTTETVIGTVTYTRPTEGPQQ